MNQGFRHATGRLYFHLVCAMILSASVLPKVLLGGTGFYVGEFLVVVGLLMLLCFAPQSLELLKFHTPTLLIAVFYVFILFGCVYSSSQAYIYAAPDFMLLIKRVLYHLVPALLAINGVLLLGDKAGVYLEKFLILILVLGLFPLLFSLFELIGFAAFGFAIPTQNLGELSLSSYSPTLFLLGFTGRAIGPDGFYLLGSSSINYGIFNAGLALLAAVVFRAKHAKRWVCLSGLYGLGALLSMSSTALIVLAMGYATLFLLEGYKALRIVLLPILGILAALGLIAAPIEEGSYFALGDFAYTLKGVVYGNEGAAHVNVRFQTMADAFHAMASNPGYLLFGAGIGGYVAAALNRPDPLIESFFVDALLNAGVVGFAALLFSFFIFALSVRENWAKRSAIGMAAKTVAVFAPGLLFANLVSGNSIQSEFVGSFFIFLLSVCYAASLADRLRFHQGPQAI